MPVFEPLPLVVLGAGLLLLVGAWMHLRGVVRDNEDAHVKSGLAGSHIAYLVLEISGARGARVEEGPVLLLDPFDRRTRTLLLPASCFHGRSIAAIALSAHAAALVLEHEHPPRASVRRLAAGLLRYGAAPALVCTILGLVLGFFALAAAGAIAFGALVAAAMASLPIDVRASRRARQVLEEAGVLTTEEQLAVRRVLRAATLLVPAMGAEALAGFVIPRAPLLPTRA